MVFRCLRFFFRVYDLNMSKLSHVKLLPDTVRGMKQLNREKFLRNLKVSVLKLTNCKVSKITFVCKKYLLKLENFKTVQNSSKGDGPYDKCLLLNPAMVNYWEDFSEDDRHYFNSHDVTEQNLGTKEIQLTYKNFKFDDIFKAVLPEGEEIVSGFSQIGHIIHVNLRDHLLEYKHLIGEVLKDKVTTCRTVVNKSDIIDNTFRYFNMEIIAGDADFIVTVKENRCYFQFDFSKVYWNSRLCTEHERVINCIKAGDVLFDVFCGVGPFALPVSKKRCKVFANDLNPEAYRWLNHNAEHNGIKMQHFNSYNLDGKEFICTIFKDYLKHCIINKKKVLSKEGGASSTIHVVMNLPAMAVEFLKYFNGLIDMEELFDSYNHTVIVYVYCFAIGDDPVETARQMVINNIGYNVTSDIIDIFDVRNVAPKKEMMKVTLRLTKELLFGVNNNKGDNEPPSKKKCV